MEVINKVIPYKRSDKYFYLFPISDPHLGSIHCAEDQLTKRRDEIGETRNALMVGVGDMIDCIRKNDKRFDIEGLPLWLEKHKGNLIETQRKRAVEIFKPVSSKIIAWGSGNHEETIHIRDNDDVARNMAEDLGVPYGGYSSFINLSFHRLHSTEIHAIKIHAWHGAGAAQTEGARIMRLMRLVNEVEAHIYLMGHLHCIATYMPQRLICRAGRIDYIQLAAVITGSWLKTYTQGRIDRPISPCYAETKGYKPSAIGAPVIRIRPDTLEFKVII